MDSPYGTGTFAEALVLVPASVAAVTFLFPVIILGYRAARASGMDIGVGPRDAYY